MKLFLFAAIALGAVTTLAAPRVYEIENDANERLKTILADKIVDSIPQLGIVVLKEEIAIGGLRDLGDIQEVRIIQPTQSIPKGLWGLKQINVEGAWAKSSGQGVVVAVSDTGIDMDHPNLINNFWTNADEIAGNKIDDDNNGYVDDVYGWDFVSEKPSSKDHHYHGTHVAGTIAATLHGKLIGVAPNAKLMNVPFLGGSGSGTEVDGAKTIVYATDNGAKIVNCSWGSKGRSEVIEKAIQYAESKGVLVVAAAGNNGEPTDRRKFFPAGAEVENVIAVAASMSTGGMASFSNFGVKSVDLAAPGYGILSSVPSKSKAKYDYLNGTSMASPHVAGAAALVWSARPNLKYNEVKSILLTTVTKSTYWGKRTSAGGILNANDAVALALSH